MTNSGVHLLPVKGIRLAAGAAGLRYENRDDVVLIEIDGGQAAVAAVMTRNQFLAAPITVAKEHLSNCVPRYLLINAGYANAGLGRLGLQDARACCRALAELAQVEIHQVLPFSTGVIGERLPVGKLTAVLPEMLTRLSEDQWEAAARAMMTTDTVAKWASSVIDLETHSVTVTGIAKGAGMICPNMATMLGFIATDIILDQAIAERLLKDACDISFNRITIDGDTSTNDACVLMASGSSGVAFVDLDADGKQQFITALNEIALKLAEQIVRDAEGAQHFVVIQVDAAPSSEAAFAVAKTVAESPLVKTAIAGGDPNWGRIIAAIGRAGVDITPGKVSVYFDNCCVFKNGMLDPEYTEEQGLQAMSGREINIRIDLGDGKEQSRVLTSDLTTEYININTQYRS